AMTSLRPDLEYPIEALIDAMDFPDVTDRNKAAFAVSTLAGMPRYRDAVRSRALETCLRLLRLEQPNNRVPAHLILMSVSGLDYGRDDHAAWERWVARQSAAEAAGDR